jgi:eukaryotic-like serine/threonine-protein kinase
MSTAAPEFLELQAVVAGRFSIEQEIGCGGMGIVFLARDVALDRPVAIKLLPPEAARTPETRERFLKEARTAAKLSHPNIVPIHLVEEHGDVVFFVMAYVHGESLGQRVRRAGPLPPSAVVKIVREVAWALSYAHDHGVVHRDVKPDNILLEKESGRAIVTDFGIARLAETGTLTGQGEFMGTVRYMSPEQATGEAVDGRSDLYSLGVTAFFALTGTLPFDGSNLPAVVYKQVNEPAPRVAVVAPRVPARVAEAVDRCLAKDPAERFQSGAELAEALGDVAVPTRGLPPELRALLRTLHDWGVGAGVAATLLYVGAMVTDAYAGLLLTSVPGYAWVTLAGMFGAIAFQFRQVTRRVLRAGITPVEIRNALLAEARAVEEERALDPRRQRWLNRLKVRPAWTRIAPLIAGGALVLMAALAGSPDLLMPGVAALAIAAGFYWRNARAVSPVRSLRWVERFMYGRGGRLLLWLAGIGMDAPERAAPALDRPTEALLAAAADDLWDALPTEMRHRVPEVPDVIRRLQADAHALRRRAEVLGDALARVDLTGKSMQSEARDAVADDLERARGAVRTRLASAVAALENLRLGLLRLTVGVGSAEGLTADFERAREAHQAVLAELEGQQEVERLLSEAPST